MENSNNIIQKPLQLPELIASLEQATLMAKQLPFTNTAAAPAVNPSVLHQIYSSLHTAHHRLSSFLFSSSSDNNNNTDTNTNAAAEPMQFDDDNQEADSKHNNSNNDDDIMIENVEERLRNCFIKNKRPKRALSPSYYAAAAAAVEDERRSREVGDGGMRGLGLGLGYDPMETRLNALELVYQFHG